MKNNDLKKVQLHINEVVSMMKSKFGEDVPHTISISLWDDDTHRVECRYGDGTKLYNATWYDGTVKFTEEELLDNQLSFKDKFDNEFVVIPQEKINV